MTPGRAYLLATVVCVLGLGLHAGRARAQDDGEAPLPSEQTGEPAAPDDADTEPVELVDVWTEWEVRAAPGARLLEREDIVRELLASDMATRTALTREARAELREACGDLGYHLVRIEIERPRAGVVKAVLTLEPRLIIRRVEIDIDRPPGAGVWESLKMLFNTPYEEPLLRRMRLRAGEVLEAEADARALQLRDEAERLREFLQDEGFFEARVTIQVDRSEVNGARIVVKAILGRAYETGRITIEREEDLAVSGAEIRALFTHHRVDVDRLDIHWLKKRFSRAQHQKDIEALTRLYQRRGYPGVRVTTTYNPKSSWDRDTRQVEFTVRIDERRRLDVTYEGNDPSWFPSDELDDQLTFDAASSADDFEVAASAGAIQRYYQSRGWFDAAVTWERERVRIGDATRGARLIDRVKYRIDAGQRRALRGVELVGNTAIPESELRAVITTGAERSSLDLLSTPTRVTAEQLAGDVERLRNFYRARGYLDVAVTVAAAPSKLGLDRAATTAALLAAEQSPTDLWVRFTIDEGPRSVLERIDIVFEGPHVATEAQVLDQLGLEAGGPYLLGDLELAGESLQRDWFWSIGRPRAEVSLEITFGKNANHLIATYRIEEHQELRIGRVVVRGNFNTEQWVITDELRFKQGALLTRDLYTNGVRRLRATGLFSAVDVEAINFEETRDGTIHVLVKVEERDDHRNYVDVEFGRSSQKAWFAKVRPVFPNPTGNGISAEVSLTRTLDTDIADVRYTSYEGLARIPRWWMRRYFKFRADTEVTAFWRRQDTDRFGFLTSWGGSIGLARGWQRPRSEGKDARSIVGSLRYDFRKVDRQEDAVRLAGNSGSISQSQVANRTGAIGVFVAFDQRVDAKGNLNPLAPARGYKFELGVSYAHRYLLGQDTFVKVHGAAQYVWSVTRRLQLRVDGRYDQGIPLGGAVLLPEVERFFAGGDDTVRGYDEDRLLVERIELPVVPFDDLTQVTILPAGGNIRLLGGVDMQLELWRLGGIPMASALFVDAGAIVNTFAALDGGDVRPSVGISLIRALTPLGGLSLEYAVPILPRDDGEQLGRWHFSVALRY